MAATHQISKSMRCKFSVTESASTTEPLHSNFPPALESCLTIASHIDFPEGGAQSSSIDGLNGFHRQQCFHLLCRIDRE